MSRRSLTPLWVAVGLVVAAFAPHPAIAQARNEFTVSATAGSGAVISFRAPGYEYDDCCSSFGYLMVIRGESSCLRRAFPAAYWRGHAEASFDEFGDVLRNGAPMRVNQQIRKGDQVTIAMHALSPCRRAYRGQVIYNRSTTHRASAAARRSAGSSSASPGTGAWR